MPRLGARHCDRKPESDHNQKVFQLQHVESCYESLESYRF